MEIYTIGFTRRTAAGFFGALKAAGVKRLVDVRLNNTTHVTRMRAPFICIAGLDLETGKHVRPVLESGQLGRSALVCHGGPFDLASIVELGPTHYVGRAPELEDWRFDRRKAIRLKQLTPVEQACLLTDTACDSLHAIFGDHLHQQGDSCAVDEGEGFASLGTLRLNERPRLAVNSFGKLRLYMNDNHCRLSLPVTDLQLYNDDHTTLCHDAVHRLIQRIDGGAGVLLNVGLSRAWLKPGDTVARHWLQVNNIHLYDGLMRQRLVSAIASRADSTTLARRENKGSTQAGTTSPHVCAPYEPLEDVAAWRAVDEAIRQAIHACQAVLPEQERSSERIEVEIVKCLRSELRLPVLQPSGGEGDKCDKSTTWHDRLVAMRTRHGKAYMRWTEDDDALIRQEFNDGATVKTLAARLERQPSAIRSRLKKLGLLEL